MTTVEILRKARELYASAPSHAPMGEPVIPGTYCIHYAVAHAGLGSGSSKATATSTLERVAGMWALTHWNATHTTEEVLALFDRAIAVEEAIEAEHTTITKEPAHA